MRKRSSAIIGTRQCELPPHERDHRDPADAEPQRDRPAGSWRPMPSSPQIGSAKPSALAITLGMSSQPRLRASSSGRARLSARFASPNGTLIANSHGHGSTARIAPPSVGPAAELVATTSRVQTERAAELCAREHFAQDRRRDRHDRRGAEALQRARRDQQRQRARQRACQRAGDEQGHAGAVDARRTAQLAERGEREQRCGDRELKAVDDPDRLGRRGVQVARDRRQRGVARSSRRCVDIATASASVTYAIRRRGSGRPSGGSVLRRTLVPRGRSCARAGSRRLARSLCASPTAFKRANFSGVTNSSTFRWRFVGCRYWPIVKMSTPIARASSIACSTSASVSPKPSISEVFVYVTLPDFLACSRI